jgi:ABC-2 type transport system permease protein
MRVWAIVLRQLYLLRESPARVIPLFAWAALDIVLWGFVTRYLDSIGAGGQDWIPVLLGAVLLWNFFGRIMQGVTTAFLEDVWSRNFLTVFASPISTGEYLLGLVVTSLLTSVVGMIVMLVLAGAGFGLNFWTYGLALLPFFVNLVLFGVALGIFGCAMVLRLGPASEWLVWPIPSLVAPFAGVFYPLSTLPSWMQIIGYGLPPSYVFEAMRGIVLRNQLDWNALFGSLALSAAYLVASAGFFTRVYKRAVQTGLLARYSAEAAD